IALAPKEEEMSSVERQRIEELVRAVDEGSYARPSSASPGLTAEADISGATGAPGSPSTSLGITDSSSLAAAIKGMSDELIRELRRMPNDEAVLMKSALKTHINKLQELQRHI
ncbi:MAG: hypothetical protein FWD27_08860, partial [Coriobacteriia bacterium]|nr:hypothetical protein [Coriobacteriia bacterium]